MASWACPSPPLDRTTPRLLTKRDKAALGSHWLAAPCELYDLAKMALKSGRRSRGAVVATPLPSKWTTRKNEDEVKEEEEFLKSPASLDPDFAEF